MRRCANCPSSATSVRLRTCSFKNKAVICARTVRCETFSSQAIVLSSAPTASRARTSLSRLEMPSMWTRCSTCGHNGTELVVDISPPWAEATLLPAPYVAARSQSNTHRLGQYEGVRGPGRACSGNGSGSVRTVDQAAFVGGDDQLRPVPGPDLGEQPADVGLGRGHGDVQVRRDLRVRQAPADQQHCSFPVGDAVER